MAAHAAFDPIWETMMLTRSLEKSKARGMAYKWLAEKMGMDKKACHISLMDRETALRVVEACRYHDAE